MKGSALAAAALAALTVFSGAASGSPVRSSLTTVTVDTLPIANALPLTLGINKGFFANHGIENQDADPAERERHRARAREPQR